MHFSLRWNLAVLMQLQNHIFWFCWKGYDHINHRFHIWRATAANSYVVSIELYKTYDVVEMLIY